MSKEEHDEELRRKKGDEAKLQMALDESRRQSAAAASVSPIHGAQVVNIAVFILSFEHCSVIVLFRMRSCNAGFGFHPGAMSPL